MPEGKRKGNKAKAAERGNYVALARRHRPTRFEDVIGQQHVTRTLQNAIRADRVHHAYLFAGSRGVGKTTVARILARALNHPGGPTPDPPVSTDPEQEARSAVDVIEIDGASHTGVDDVRELRENARYLPSRSRYKIYIIDEVHMLSTSAFNALLKTLEEPPPHVVFVFATTEPHKIPATILSRCQRFDFKRVPTPALSEHLQRLAQTENIAVQKTGLALLARAAEGGVRDALSLLDQVVAYASATEEITADQIAEVLGVADRRVLFALSAAVLDRDAAAALGIVDQLFADGHDLSQVANAFTAHLRDLVVTATCEQPGELVDATDAELQELTQQSARAAPGLLHQLFERFAHAAEQIARSSFPRLLLEMAVIELAQAEPALPLGDLLQRLEGLERRLDAGTIAGGGGNDGIGAGSRGSRPRGGATSKSSAPSRRAAPSQPPVPAPQAPPDDDQDGVTVNAGTTATTHATGPTDPAATAGRNGRSRTGFAAPSRAAMANEDGVTADSGADENGFVRWRTLLEQLQVPSVGIYASGRLISWEGQCIEIGYPADAFELQGAQDKARQQSFAKACAAKLGYSPRLKVRALRADEQQAPEVAKQSAIQAKDQARRERNGQLREEARAHPITRTLVDEFGATIKRIETDAEGTQR